MNPKTEIFAQKSTPENDRDLGQRFPCKTSTEIEGNDAEEEQQKQRKQKEKNEREVGELGNDVA